MTKNERIRYQILSILARMDERLDELEQNVYLPQKSQYREINKLAEIMGVEPGYENLIGKADRETMKEMGLIE